MNRKKLLALALALVLLLSTGVFAYAQSADSVATPSELGETVTAAEEIPSEPSGAETEGNSSGGSGTTEISNVVLPGTELMETPEEHETPATPEPPQETPAESETPETPEQPEETPSEQPGAAESDPVIIPDIPETPETLVSPEIEQTAEPTVEPAPYVSPYANVPAGTRLYRDKARTVKLGELLTGTVMLVRADSTYENGGVLYEAFFITDQSLQDNAFETAYFYSSSLEYLTKEQTDVCLSTAAAYKADGKPVLNASVLYEELPGEESEETEGDSNVSHVNRPDVNMRSEPSTKASRVAKLQKGENVEVTAKVASHDGDAWYAVTYQGMDGYIRADLVTVIGDVPEMTGDASTKEEAEPTAEPEAQLPEETEQPVAEDMPILYTVKYFNANGELLTAYEVEGGKTFDQEVYLFQNESFLGWYPCDENGSYTGTASYDFSQPVEGPVYIRARMSGQAETAAEEPEEGQTENEAAEQKISVAMTYDTETLQLGSRITLTATLEGYEGLNYTCYWQYAAADSDGNITGEWQNAQADTLSLTYTLAVDNLLTAWRMCVLINP